MAVSSDGGATWTEKPAATGPNRQWDPMTTVSADGVIHLGYMQYPTGDDKNEYLELYYVSSADGWKTTTTPRVMNGVRCRFPHLFSDPERNVLWYVTKDERDHLPPNQYQADVFLWYSLDGGASWSEGEFATDHGSDEVGYQGYALGPDGSLHVNYLLWPVSGENRMLYTTRPSPVTSAASGGNRDVVSTQQGCSASGIGTAQSGIAAPLAVALAVAVSRARRGRARRGEP